MPSLQHCTLQQHPAWHISLPPPRSSTQGWNQFGGFTLFSFYFFYIFNAVISQSALLKRFFFFSSLLKFSRIDSLFLMFHKSLF